MPPASPQPLPSSAATCPHAPPDTGPVLQVPPSVAWYLAIDPGIGAVGYGSSPQSARAAARRAYFGLFGLSPYPGLTDAAWAWAEQLTVARVEVVVEHAGTVAEDRAIEVAVRALTWTSPSCPVSLPQVLRRAGIVLSRARAAGGAR